MDITELRTETAEWDAFVRASGEGSPFQLVAWKRAVERTFGLRAHYLMARENGRLVGVLPLFEARGLFGARALISVPYAVYGGICATSDAARRALVDAATVLGRKRRAAYVELRQRRDLELGLTVKQRYVAFARSISKDEEENALAIPRKRRRMIRQGPRYGLRSAAERRPLDSVYDVYAQSVHTLGSPVFPRRLFHALAEAFEEDCHVLAVYHDERIVAGVLSFFYEDQVLPYYGGGVREAVAYSGHHFMYLERTCLAPPDAVRSFHFVA